jgi:hypothetical protein
VGHDHVAVGTGLLVEGDAVVEGQGLGHVDLHVVDVDAVPDGLEQSVGEPEGQDVERRLLAQEVVDPEDLLLGEGLVQRGVELLGAGHVHAERLLHDDPRPLDQAGLVEHPHDRQRGRGRHAQVVEPAAVAAQGALGVGHGLGQRLRPAVLGDERHLALEVGPLVVGDRSGGVLLVGPSGQVTEPGVVELVERRADDADVGHEPRHRQPHETGQQLALGQVAGGAEQHDDVGFDRRHQAPVDVDRVGLGHGRRLPQTVAQRLRGMCVRRVSRPLVPGPVGRGPGTTRRVPALSRRTPRPRS